ncbi:uncharacterized protein LOC142475787 [Ascaphus truei]|uniref:uncharacterized protein LOC142475787 n=1 Tax=Ascaphus truei TaxID=8439 RepID=UPI003F5A4265
MDQEEERQFRLLFNQLQHPVNTKTMVGVTFTSRASEDPERIVLGMTHENNGRIDLEVDVEEEDRNMGDVNVEDVHNKVIEATNERDFTEDVEDEASFYYVTDSSLGEELSLHREDVVTEDDEDWIPEYVDSDDDVWIKKEVDNGDNIVDVATEDTGNKVAEEVEASFYYVSDSSLGEEVLGMTHENKGRLDLEVDVEEKDRNMGDVNVEDVHNKIIEATNERDFTEDVEDEASFYYVTDSSLGDEVSLHLEDVFTEDDEDWIPEYVDSDGDVWIKKEVDNGDIVDVATEDTGNKVAEEVEASFYYVADSSLGEEVLGMTPENKGRLDLEVDVEEEDRNMGDVNLEDVHNKVIEATKERDFTEDVEDEASFYYVTDSSLGDEVSLHLEDVFTEDDEDWIAEYVDSDGDVWIKKEVDNGDIVDVATEDTGNKVAEEVEASFYYVADSSLGEEVLGMTHESKGRGDLKVDVEEEDRNMGDVNVEDVHNKVIEATKERDFTEDVEDEASFYYVTDSSLGEELSLHREDVVTEDDEDWIPEYVDSDDDVWIKKEVDNGDNIVDVATEDTGNKVAEEVEASFYYVADSSLGEEVLGMTHENKGRGDLEVDVEEEDRNMGDVNVEDVHNKVIEATNERDFTEDVEDEASFYYVTDSSLGEELSLHREDVVTEDDEDWIPEYVDSDDDVWIKKEVDNGDNIVDVATEDTGNKVAEEVEASFYYVSDSSLGIGPGSGG